MNIKNIPVFIICRDKVKDLKVLVDWFSRCGFNNIYLIDNDSSYPELLDFYESTSCHVIKLKENVGASSPWSKKIVQRIAKDSYYIVSDPDITPIEDCPEDAIEHFYYLLQKYPQYGKAGFSLKIDDLPECYKFRDEVVTWEQQFFEKEIEPFVYEAFIDTTLALYRPHATRGVGRPCIRTAYPYQARHMPWYTNSEKLTEEEVFYKSNCGEGGQNHGTWGRDTLPLGLIQKIEHMRCV